MKQNCLALILMLIVAVSVKGQLLPVRDFGSISLGDFSHPDFHTNNIQQYPYLDIGIVVENTEMLSNAEFLKKFGRAKHFFTEVKARYNGNNFSVPIILMQKERNDRGAFTAINNISSKIFEKIPVIENADISPSFTISNEITIQNGLINALRILTDNANTLLSLDIKNSLNKPKEVLSFVSKVLSGMENSTFTVSSTFTPFMFDDPTRNKIYAFKLTGIIPPNDHTNYEARYFNVKRDVGNEIKLYYKQYLFPHPYCLLVLSLSNYVHLEGLPSSFLQSKTLASVTQQAIVDMKESMIRHQARLSLDQAKYESYLIAYLETYLAVQTGENIQRQLGSPERDLKLIEAYNYLFELSGLEKSFQSMSGNGRALFSRYQQMATPIRDAILLSANNLDHSKLCSETFSVKRIDCDKIKNSHLRDLYRFNNAASGTTYLQQVKYAFDVQGKINECEGYVFNSKFKSVCEELSTEHPSTTSISTLRALKAEYADCKLCQDKAFAAEKNYQSVTAAAQSRETNLGIIRVSEAISAFDSEVNAWYLSNTTKIQDSKDSLGVTRLKFDFQQKDYDSDIAAIKAYQQRAERLRDSSRRQEIESMERDLRTAITRFKEKYFKSLVAI